MFLNHSNVQRMYFDLHLHPTTKPFLTGPALGPKERNCWEKLDNPIMDIIGSQSSLGQLVEGKVNLAVACLYVLETPFTYNFIIEHIVPIISFAKASSMQLASNDQAFLRLMAELELLKSSQGLGRKKLQFLQSYQEITPQHLNLILAVEGAHCFGIKEDILTNFTTFKNSGHRLLYLTLTHLTRADCASHAHSIKLIKKNDQFKPGGGGLYDLGKKVIDLAYNESVGGHRVFIDVKHMSLVARKDFYAYRKQMPGYEDIPILASHAACTGISWKKIRNYIKQQRIKDFDIPSEHSPEDKYAAVVYKDVPGLSGTEFNPVSINLYDEDIVNIIQSKGLIGLILEKKMVGLHKKSAEFFELAEYAQVLGQRGTPRGDDDDQDYEEDAGFEADEKHQKIADARQRMLYRLHLKHIANQILHIVTVAGAEAWDHLCIGSDFDGLISSVHCCEDASEYEIIAADLPAVLLEMAAENPRPDNYHINNIVAQVGKIFYGNAMRFLAKHWNSTLPEPVDPIPPVVV